MLEGVASLPLPERRAPRHTLGNAPVELFPWAEAELA